MSMDVDKMVDEGLATGEKLKEELREGLMGKKNVASYLVKVHLRQPEGSHLPETPDGPTIARIEEIVRTSVDAAAETSGLEVSVKAERIDR